MKKFKKSIIGLVMSLAILSYSVIPAFAAENVHGTGAANKGTVKEVIFKNIYESPSQSFKGIDEDGNPYTVSVEKVESSSLTDASIASIYATTTWKVSYAGGFINCSFYMDVCNNKVISAYDKWIMTTACTYSNVSFTKDYYSYAKLAFDVTSYASVFQFTGWLKGTLTGSGNDITVSYQM